MQEPWAHFLFTRKRLFMCTAKRKRGHNLYNRRSLELYTHISEAYAQKKLPLVVNKFV